MVTVDDIIALNPCAPYTNRDRLLEIFKGKESVDVSDVLDFEIPVVDRLWLIYHSGLIRNSVMIQIRNALATTAGDQNEEHVVRYVNNWTLFGFGQLAHSRAAQKGTTFREEYEAIQNEVIPLVRSFINL